MFSFFLVVASPVALFLLARRVFVGPLRDRAMAGLLAGYALRMVLSFFLRDLPLFSYGSGGGDNGNYEAIAAFVAKLWETRGVEWATPENTGNPVLATAALPLNLFAAIMYLDGSPGRVGCIALIAFVAALTVLFMFQIATEFGAEPKNALIILGLFYYSPNFIFHTCDTFKDGLVAFFILAALGSSFRLAERFSVGRLAAVVLALWALWYVRYYLVFMALAPLFIGFIGMRTKSIVRPIIASIVVITLIAGAGRMIERVEKQMAYTYSVATSSEAREWNAYNGAENVRGSGVVFDDGGDPWGAIGPKIAYTLFSPFPWMPGSMGMQIGKLDAFLWYWIMYRAWRSTRRLWKEDRRLLLMFFVFLVPATVAYATTMANVGLIVRQRIPIVLFTVLLASLSWPKRRTEERDAGSSEADDAVPVPAKPVAQW